MGTVGMCGGGQWQFLFGRQQARGPISSTLSYSPNSSTVSYPPKQLNSELLHQDQNNITGPS